MREKEPEFYACGGCGLVVEVLRGEGAKLENAQLQKLEPGTSDGARGKHLPAVTREGGRVTVQVGSVEHPMSAEHGIEWIYLSTKKGGQRADLHSTDAPPGPLFLLMEDDGPWRRMPTATCTGSGRPSCEGKRGAGA